MHRNRLTRLAAILCLLAGLWGCALKEPEPPREVAPGFVPVSEEEAAGLTVQLTPWMQGIKSWTALAPGLEDNLAYIRRRRQDAVAVDRPGLTLTWGQLGDSVAEFMALLPDLDRDPQLLAERFQWLALAPRTLLTGYYEPWLEASLERKGRYQYPLYGVPDDLKTAYLGRFHYRWKGETLTYRLGEDGIEPYHDRRAIDSEGALEGRGLEIAWVKDPVDVFFLQIQGSGRLVLPDGSVKHILYGGKNGRRYVSLGRLLIEEGEVPREEMSMQRIRRFLASNPYTAQEWLNRNPSYVFFKLSDEGPYGSIGSILTPRVSVAVDRTMIPLGSVLALNTALMDYENGQADPFFSLVLAQDTGGAIKNTRMDLFCGSGEEAEYLAGHLQEDARVYMLVSNQVLGESAKE